MLTVSDNSNNGNTPLSYISTEKKSINTDELQKIQLSYRQSLPQILTNEKQNVDNNNNNNNIFNDKAIQTASNCSFNLSKPSSNFNNLKLDANKCGKNFNKDKKLFVNFVL